LGPARPSTATGPNRSSKILPKQPSLTPESAAAGSQAEQVQGSTMLARLLSCHAENKQVLSTQLYISIYREIDKANKYINANVREFTREVKKGW
jgi:hypothetical protein